MMAQPQVELWLPQGRWAGEAEDVTDHPNATAWLREVLIASAFAAELAGLHPRRMSDAELQAATADYRLIHIRRTQPLAGPGGPGDLAWVWWVLGVMWLVWRWRRPKESIS
ncbi:MAG: hypothetical protein GXP37_08195 [Chloroflexi bacterium]|nr:hypothetical protein [Chloroflexota bacterium]